MHSIASGGAAYSGILPRTCLAPPPIALSENVPAMKEFWWLLRLAISRIRMRSLKIAIVDRSEPPVELIPTAAISGQSEKVERMMLLTEIADCNCGNDASRNDPVLLGRNETSLGMNGGHRRRSRVACQEIRKRRLSSPSDSHLDCPSSSFPPSRSIWIPGCGTVSRRRLPLLRMPHPRPTRRLRSSCGA